MRTFTLLLLTALILCFPPPVYAQTGTNLFECIAPVTGNGRGMAFDGFDLYYTIATAGNIFQIDTAACGLQATIVPTCPGGAPLNRAIGALAFDNTGATPTLWAGTYDGFTNPATIFQVDIATGTILQTIGSLPTNGGDPFPQFLDGLAFDPGDNSLFYSSDLGVEVFNISAVGGAGCTPAAAVQNAARGFVFPEGDLSGLAFDGFDLYSGQPADGFSGTANTNPPPQILQTPDNAPVINLNFQTLFQSGAGLQAEDLAFDDFTFAPLCAVWADAVADDIAAFEVPCPVILVDIDVKFCSNPNGFNCKQKGKTPVTIFGTSTFDVNDIDISSLQLCEAGNLINCTGPPLDWSVFDRGDPTTDLGAAMCAIDPTTGEELDWLNPDGFDDLDVAFATEEVVGVIGCAGLNKGDASLTLVLVGQTAGGTPISSVPIGDVGIDQLLIQKN